jgi:hypothetical protein
MNDLKTIDREDEMKTGVSAAEARCVPKQNSNDEGSAQDLQIEVAETQGSTEHFAGSAPGKMGF